MKRYSPDAPCPKCGHDVHSVKHVNMWPVNKGEEFLIVTCHRCRYQYRAHCLDANGVPDEQ